MHKKINKYQIAIWKCYKKLIGVKQKINQTFIKVFQKNIGIPDIFLKDTQTKLKKKKVYVIGFAKHSVYDIST